MSDNLNMIDNSCKTLSEIAKAKRQEAAIVNVYINQEGRRYNVNHPNAKANVNGTDDPQNIKGKGTGVFLDSSGGGGFYDIYGDPSIPNTGRNAVNFLNKYTADKPYNCLPIVDEE